MNLLPCSSIYKDTIYTSWSYSVSQTSKLCASLEDESIMWVTLGSERREVTVKILYPQIFAGISTFNLQGQIKYESKNNVQVLKNVEQFYFSSWYHENKINGLLSHFELWWHRWSSCRRLQGTSDQALKKCPISFLIDHDDWGLWQFRNHHLNDSSFLHQLWQQIQADEYLSWAKASPFAQWCASVQNLSPCLSVLVINCELPSKAAIHGKRGTVRWYFGPQYYSPTWTALPA